MSTAKSKQPAKPSPMKSMRLIDASKKLEGLRFDETRGLDATERATWARARRGPGRPHKPAGEKAARVVVTVAPDLLAEADDYARREGISRAELFARGLMAILSKGTVRRRSSLAH